MKSSRTSTNKKVVKKTVNNKKVSTSPSSVNTKNTLNRKNTTNTVRKSKTNSINNAKNQRNNVNRNSHSAKNNLRLNKVIQDSEFVPFFDEESVQKNIKPNTLRKVEPEKDTKQDKKRKVKSITIIKIAFFIALFICVLYLMFNLETFNLTEIKVKGNEKYTQGEIISKSNLRIGDNIFKQLFFSGKNEIQLAYISKAKFEYSFPNTIVIDVKERYPAYIALDKNTSNYYKIDNEGFLLEKCDLSQKKDEIIVEGFVFEENVELGKKINEVYIKKLEIYNNIKTLLEKYEIEGNITKVNFSNSLTTISLDDKLKIVFSNDSNLEYKVSFLKGIIQKNGGVVEGTIDMSIENPVYSKYN